jgi:nucleoside-diphosphate-sugar epimerase
MKVFVAGATGAIGLPTVRQLIAAGHDVIGMTRTPTKRSMLQLLGARPVVADALVPAQILDAISTEPPDAVVQLLTAIPKRGPMRLSEMRATNELRTRGTANVVAAVRAAGVRRYVAESIAFSYGLGGSRVFTESDPVETQPPAAMRPVLEALLRHEKQVLEAEGIVLRFGLFYGPGSGSTEYMVKMMRRRMMPLIGGGRGVLPWVHIEDAAAAVVASLERGKPGEIYNIVDDAHASLREVFGEIARAVGAPRPWSIPTWLARLAVPYLARGFIAEIRVSNEKARRELGWEPVYPTYQEAARSIAGSVEA